MAPTSTATRASTRIRKSTVNSIKTPAKPVGILKQKTAAKVKHENILELESILKRAAAPGKVPSTTNNVAVAHTRKCMGCKTEHASELFLALFPKTLEDFKEKCFKCRRVDAIGDYVKTHNKGGNPTAPLSLALQMDHLETQKEACLKWKRTMGNRGFDISDDYLNSVIEAVKAHPALTKVKGKASVHFADDNLNTPPAPRASSIEKEDIATTVTASVNPLLDETAAAFHRAANALDIARTLHADHFDRIIRSVFRRDFEANIVTTWVNMLTESVDLMVATKGVWEKMGENDFEAARTLAGLKFGSM